MIIVGGTSRFIAFFDKCSAMTGKIFHENKIGISVSRDAYRPGIPSPFVYYNMALGLFDVKG